MQFRNKKDNLEPQNFEKSLWVSQIGTIHRGNCVKSIYMNLSTDQAVAKSNNAGSSPVYISLAQAWGKREKSVRKKSEPETMPGNARSLKGGKKHRKRFREKGKKGETTKRGVDEPASK